MVKHGGPDRQLAGFLGDNPVDDHHLNQDRQHGVPRSNPRTSDYERMYYLIVRNRACLICGRLCGVVTAVAIYKLIGNGSFGPDA